MAGFFFLRGGRRDRMVAASPLLLAVLLGVLAAGWLGACAVSKRVVRDPWQAGPAPRAGQAGPRPVRVGLAEDRPEQRLGCTGPWELRSSRGGVILALGAADSLSVWNLQGRVMYASDLQGGRVDRVVVAPASPEHVLVWDGEPWRGALHVIATPDGDGVTVINVVELESYLAGVLPREIGRGRPASQLAALAAQAVAARTYVAARLGAREARGFDVYADVRDQVYSGAAVEDSLCTAAIAATAGLVLRSPDGTLADAFFHSTCAGHTAAKDAVWPTAPDPLLPGVPDRRPDGQPWCAASKYSQWTATWTWSELEGVLARTLPGYLDYLTGGGRVAWRPGAFSAAGDAGGADGREPGRLLDLRVHRRTDEGRVDVLEITCDAGIYRVRGDQTRRVLVPADGRPSMLRSAWFDLEVEAGTAVIARGRGWGHGLGMCQMGALGRAEAGQDVAGILAAYYPGARLESLDPVVLP